MLRRASVADRLRHVRHRVGLTQEQLAEAIGTDRLHVLKWERGAYNPSRRYQQKIADATGYPVEFFAEAEAK